MRPFVPGCPIAQSKFSIISLEQINKQNRAKTFAELIWFSHQGPGHTS